MSGRHGAAFSLRPYTEQVTEIPVVIDRASPVPLYHQLAEQLTAAIDDGRLKAGDPFENELLLAARLDLSRPTVRRAIGELVDRGLLIRRRGVGTTVASPVIHRRDELTSLYDDMARRGSIPQTAVLDLATHAVDADAAGNLGLASDTAIVRVRRLRSVDGTPTAIMQNWLPPQFSDLTVADLTDTSLYAILRQRGCHPVIAHQSIGARRPRRSERRLLDLPAGTPLLTMTRRAYAADGTAVEFGDHCYRSDQYAFDVTVRAH